MVSLTLLPLQFAVTTASELYTFISKSVQMKQYVSVCVYISYMCVEVEVIVRFLCIWLANLVSQRY